MQSEIDYYSILRLKPGSSMDDVRRQYRRLAKVYHPDRNPGEEEWCAEQLTQVNKAYEYLSDPERKAAYDSIVRGKPNEPGSRPAGGAHQSPNTGARSNHKQSPRSEFPSTAHSSAVSRANTAPRTAKAAPRIEQSPPLGRQIATMLLGGIGVGAVGAGLSMALFAYLHPPQSRDTVLPVQVMYDDHANHTAPKHVELHVVHHHTHLRREEAEMAKGGRKTSVDSREADEARLRNLGVQVPDVGFSDKELHDMAARLQAYDRSH